MDDKDKKKKPAAAPPLSQPAKPAAPSARPPAPASPAAKAPATAAKPDVPPAADRAASAAPRSTKASHGVTKTILEGEASQKIKDAVAKEVSARGVIKVPEYDAPKPGTKVAAWTEKVTVTAPQPPAPPTMADGSPAPAPPPLVLDPKVQEKIPAWYRPSPDDPFPLSAKDHLVDFYPILEPFAYVLLTTNEDDKETVYRAIEPQLTADEAKILRFVEQTMVDVLDTDPDDLERENQEEYLAKKFEEILYDYAIVLGDDEGQEQATKGKLLYYIYRDFIGEGPIDILTRDDLIEDISCDGAHQPVFLYHRRHESIKSNIKFTGDEQLDSFVIRLAQRAGKHISIAEPILDATMADGSRIQATLSREVSAHGSTFTIRKFRSEPFTPPDLVKFGTMSAEILAYWWIAIQNGASAIYAGGTASGKTTGLNAILLFIPPQMKIVSIEDTRELSLPHPNWIAGITRTGFGVRDAAGRQVGEIDMFQLLKNALRQRPEYIIVGEVRGKEAFSLFQAMATGHAAYGTMHADGVDAVIHRLESDPINIPRSLLEALDIVSIQIQTRVGGKRVRRTKQLSEIVGVDPHTREILTNEVFTWQPKDDSFKFSGVSYVLERIQTEKGMTAQQMKRELENRVEIIKYMIRNGVRNYREVARIVSTYYKDPELVMKRVRADEPWT